MRIDINPFFSRPSESLGADDKFINLFCPDVLDIFDDKRPLWDIVNVIRSAPGGGKTTLLKLFTPDILLRIKNKQKDEYQLVDIYRKLKFLGVYDEEDKPLLISTLIPFTSEYSTLEYLTINEPIKKHLFFSLLNTRIILSVLYSFCKIRNLEFPEDLIYLNVTQDPAKTGHNPFRNKNTGKEIYDWCCENEERICGEIDNITITDINTNDKVVELYALHLFSDKNLIYKGIPVKEKILVMFDDVHNLSKTQRHSLMKNIIDKRPLVNVWIAERLQALTMEEIISDGNILNRDYVLVNLEQFWSKGTKFQKFVSDVAEKRLLTIADGESTLLSTYLSEEIDNEYSENSKKYIMKIQDRIKSRHNRKKYEKWLNTIENLNENEFETLVEWKRLEILINRHYGNSQQELAFDEFLDEGSLIHQNGSDIENAARLFLHDEFRIPYYYGIEKISRLSSSNIEQFLNIAGKLFEAISLNQLKKISQNKSSHILITPKKQDALIKKLSEEKWRELDIRIPNALNIKNFLNNFCLICRSHTYIDNAWNSPGINGIAITMREREILKSKAINDTKHSYHEIAKLLATSIAYNLLDFRLNYKVQGKEVMILYINRIYCAKYGLPLNNGKFKILKLDDLKGLLNKNNINQINN